MQRRSPSPTHRKGATLRACCALLAVLASGGGDTAAGWREKVDARLLERATREPVEFLIVLESQADLRALPVERSARARRERVIGRLREVADRSQAPLAHWLQSRGVEYRAFWIANVIWARAGLRELESLATRDDVRRIEANSPVRLPPPPDVAPAAEPKSAAAIEWNVAKVRADQVWALGYTGQGVVVGGQDTGYAWDHPALIRQYRGWDGFAASHDYAWHDAIHDSSGPCGADAVAPCDDLSHGTHTMGIMVGDDGGANRIGVAPGARWIGCRNMDEGVGTPASYAECFQWFIAPTDGDDENPDPAMAPDVINNSWVCPPFEGCAYDTLRAVVEHARAAGIVVVSSAGNEGPACATVTDPPAIYDASLSVGATGTDDSIATFSSRGPVAVDGSGRLKPDVSAPGVAVRSSVPGDGYTSFNGTSMAGPHVAGVVALLLSARPDLAGQVDAIEELIARSTRALTTTENCGDLPGGSTPNNTYGHGRVDALEMLLGDADADLASNLEDCLPLESSVWSLPAEARELTLSGGPATLLGWTPSPDPGASEATTRVLRSTTAADFSAAFCLVPDGDAATDPTIPQSVFYYLVQVENGCGRSLGTSRDAPPRVGVACP